MPTLGSFSTNNSVWWDYDRFQKRLSSWTFPLHTFPLHTFPLHTFPLHTLLTVDTQRKSPGVFCKSSLTSNKVCWIHEDRKCVRSRVHRAAEFALSMTAQKTDKSWVSRALHSQQAAISLASQHFWTNWTQTQGKWSHLQSFGSSLLSLPRTALPVEFFKLVVSRGSLMQSH